MDDRHRSWGQIEFQDISDYRFIMETKERHMEDRPTGLGKTGIGYISEYNFKMEIKGRQKLIDKAV